MGTTQSIADDLQAWLEAEGTDGFAVIKLLVTDGLRGFSEHFVPELVWRGLFRSSMKAKLSETIWAFGGQRIVIQF